MNEKNFLVVPASKWQLGLIKYLKKKRFNVFSLDDDDNAIGHKYSNSRIHIKTKNIPNLKIFCKKKKLIPITCSSDFGIKTIYKIEGKKFPFFNKLQQRKIQKKIKLDTPLFFNNETFNLRKFKICKKKVISKPVIGSGSNGVNYHEKFKKYSDNKIFYEQYIHGTEYNVEGILYNKKLFFFAIMQKKKKSKLVSYILKKNSLSKHLINEIQKVISRFVLYSKYPDGPFHLEIIVEKNTKKIFIVEGHPREAGFNMFFFTCSKLTGLNLYEITNKLKLEKKINPKTILNKKIYSNFCCRMIPIDKEGKIKKIFFKKFNDKKGIKTYTDIFVKKNKYISNNKNDSSRLASIQSFSKNNKLNLENYTLNILKKYFITEYY